MLLGITIILCLGYLYTRYQLSKLNQESNEIGKTDTVYVSKPFKYTPSYKTKVLPNYVFFYGKAWSDSTVTKVNQEDTIHKKDSLVQILLNKDNLSLAFFNTEVGDFFKKDFKLNLDNYSYNWVNGQLSQKKLHTKFKLSPYVSAQFRPFHKMADLGLGLSLKTQNIQYKLGFNGYYYPHLNDNLGLDLEFSITYNLE